MSDARELAQAALAQTEAKQTHALIEAFTMPACRLIEPRVAHGREFIWALFSLGPRREFSFYDGVVCLALMPGLARAQSYPIKKRAPRPAA